MDPTSFRGAADTPAESQWPPSNCQPQILRILDYWRRISPPGLLPGRQHFDPVDIPKLLPYIWLLDVVAAPLTSLRFRFRMRLVGTHVASGFERKTTGMWIDEVWPTAAAQHGTYEHYVGVVETALPSFRRGPPAFDPDQDYKWVERILLPMARDGTHVDMILATSVFFEKRP